MNKSGYVIDIALNSETKTQLRALTESLAITEDDVCASVGLTPSDIGDGVADKRVAALFKVCGRAQAWFDTPTEMWHWFTTQSLVGFGGKTPADIIRDYDGQEGDALMQFIESKQLGGIE